MMYIAKQPSRISDLMVVHVLVELLYRANEASDQALCRVIRLLTIQPKEDSNHGKS